MNKMSTSDSVFQTGYFARASQNGLTAKSTKVHVVENGKPVCGYRPHKTMQFCWTANGIYLRYVDCPKCKAKCVANNPDPKLQQSDIKPPLRSKTTIQDLLDVIHFTVIKNEKVNKKILKEIQSIEKKIQSGKLPNYNVQTPMWWTCLFADMKENGYEIKQ